MSNPFDAAIPAMIECYEANQRDYRNGLLKPHYPVPALLQDSCSDLAERWSSWMDADRSFGIKY